MRSTTRFARCIIASAVGLFGISISSSFAAILYNPVVTLVGDGTAPDQSGQGKTTTIQIYNNTQANQSNPISQLAYNSGSGTGNMLINSSTSSSEGELSNNPGVTDAAAAGQSYSGTTYVYSAGYNAANDTENVKGTSTGSGATLVVTGPDRSVGYMNVTGSAVSGATVAATQTGTVAYDGNNIRSATGNDAATQFWSGGNDTTGSAGGFRYFNTNTKVTTTGTGNVRSVAIQGGRLFGSTADSEEIYMIAGPPPTSSGNTATKLISLPKNQDPNEFALIDDPSNSVSTTNSFGYNTCYIADDGGGGTGDVGGIQKWVYQGGSTTNWTLAYTLTDGSAVGYEGLAAQLDPTTGKIVLWATTADGTMLEQVTDTGSGAAFTTLATAPANDLFHGVALSSVVPEPTSMAMLALGGIALISRKRKY